MAPIRNAASIFNKVPADKHALIPGETLIYDASQTIDIDSPDLLKDEQIAVKSLIFSVDPFMRAMMRDPADTSFSFPSYQLGGPTSGPGFGKVVRSKNGDFKEGDYVSGQFIPHREYNVLQLEGLQRVEVHPSFPKETYCGMLSVTGFTAWMGWKVLSKAKAGETLYVNSSAGGVGSIVVQLAKLDGLKVIAATGNDEKVEYLKNELGADVAFNYKTTDLETVLKEHGPVDIFWDHVGANEIDTVLGHVNNLARVIIAGFMAGPHQITKNGMGIIRNNVTIHGFLATAVKDRSVEMGFPGEVVKLLATGKLKENMYITEGLENEGQAFIDLFSGKNIGKSILRVADD